MKKNDKSSIENTSHLSAPTHFPDAKKPSAAWQMAAIVVIAALVIFFGVLIYQQGSMNKTGAAYKTSLLEANSSSGAIIVEAESSAVEKTGQWTKGGPFSQSSGNIMWSNTAGDKLTFTFRGTRLILVGNKQKNAGIMQVKIDGTQSALIDQYNSIGQWQVEMPVAKNLENTRHTAEIIVYGKKNPASSDYYVLVDYFTSEVQPPNTTTLNTTTVCEQNGGTCIPAHAGYGCSGQWSNYSCSGNARCCIPTQTQQNLSDLVGVLECLQNSETFTTPSVVCALKISNNGNADVVAPTIQAIAPPVYQFHISTGNSKILLDEDTITVAAGGVIFKKYAYPFLKPGKYVFQINADATSVVEELNEDNNIATASVIVP